MWGCCLVIPVFTMLPCIFWLCFFQSVEPLQSDFLKEFLALNKLLFSPFQAALPRLLSRGVRLQCRLSSANVVLGHGLGMVREVIRCPGGHQAGPHGASFTSFAHHTDLLFPPTAPSVSPSGSCLPLVRLHFLPLTKLLPREIYFPTMKLQPFQEEATTDSHRGHFVAGI